MPSVGKRASAKHELREAREVRRGAKQPGVPRHAAQFRGVLIVHDPGHRVAVPCAGGSDARPQRGGRPE